MGRKIPGGKHKGVKDPVKQQAKRNALLKNKINAPPAILDFQEIPKSVERIQQINKAIKDGTMSLTKKKRKKNKRDWLINTENLDEREIKLPGMTRAEKPVPKFLQQPGETDEHFLHRLEQACHNVIQESKFEQKFGVNVNVNHDTGEVSVSKRVKDELDDLDKPLVKKHRKTEAGTSMKKEKRKQKQKEMKLKKLERKDDDFEKFRDNVKFGEVVHAPPSLTTLPKKAANKDITARPGRKDLLLKSILQTNGDAHSIHKRQINSLSKEKLELRRLRAVEAYRMLKSQKRSNI